MSTGDSSGPPRQIWKSAASRPASSSSSRRRPIERSADSNVCDMPIQPSPWRAARRSAASLSPPTRIGGHGSCTHLGTNTAPSKSKNSPWWSTVVLGPQLLAHLDRLVDAAAPGREVELGRDPLLLEPARTDPELEAAARDDVEGLDGARRDERVAQPEVVDVRAQPDALRPARQVRQVREGVEDRRVGRNRRVRLARVRGAAHLRREDQVLGKPHRLEPEPLGLERAVDEERRVEPAECDPELHGAPQECVRLGRSGA